MKVLDQKLSPPVPKHWLCHTKHLEFTQKTRVSPNYSNMYHYAGNNPVKYVDPDGCDIKGMVRGALKITLASLEMKSGMGMLAAAVAGGYSRALDRCICCSWVGWCCRNG